MNKKLFLSGVLAMQFGFSLCQGYFSPGEKVFNKDSITSFSLSRPGGSVTHLKASVKKILVVAFLSPECPLCKNYSVKLENIKKKYATNADFIGIIPGSFEANDVVEFQKNYMPSWKLLRDTSLMLTHYLQGKVTPEVLVIDNKDGRLIYKGAIDDWLVSLGKTKSHISIFFLDVALNNFLTGKSSIPFIKPVGCLINDF